MKTIITWTAVLITLVGTVAAFATPPRTINYQGYLNFKGAPASGPLGMTFSLYSSSPARNNPVWRETQPAVPVTNGIYSVQLGSVIAISALFDKPYFLGVQIESDPEMDPQPLTSAPYALRAALSDNASSIAGQTLTSLDSRYNDPTRPVPTALQIATLRWDKLRGGSNSINVLNNPMALAFDGSSVWVATRNSNSVVEINPATGAMGSPVTVGTYPRALAFDGSSIWVANQNSSSVQKINPVTGVAGAPITVGTTPYALAFDGSSIWVANYGSSSVQKINPVTGVAGAPITVGQYPSGLAFDGSSIWVASYGDSSVQKINTSNGSVGLPISVGANPTALAFDGSFIWVANYVGNSVQKINPATGAVGTAITVGANPAALAFDGSSVWVANYSGNSVQKINPSTGAVGAPITVGMNPQGLAFDGSTIWVANFGSGTVTRLAAAAEPVGVQTVGSEQINGALNLPVDGLTVGGSQLVASSGKVGIGGQPSNAAVFQVFNPTTNEQAALFQISNPANVLPAVHGSTAGSGQAVFGMNTGTGRAGHFQISNPGSSASALVAETSGSGYAGEFLGNLKLTGSISFADASTLTTAKTDCMGGRYEDNGDGTVSDCRTGLIWLKDADCLETSGGIDKRIGFLKWADAGIWVAGLQDGLCGLSDRSSAGDWRLPTMTEWMAMVASARKQGFSGPIITNRAGTGPWSEGDLFDHVKTTSTYWSSRTHSSNTTAAWTIFLYDGYVTHLSKTDTNVYVWPVRAGQ